MKKFLKITSLVIIVVFLGIQLVPVDRTNPPTIADTQIPEEVKAILKPKCYDCHSNESTWPWYSYVAPLSWWIADHVHEGRREVNYSLWDTYSEDKQEQKLEETYDEILDEFMPLESYLITHPDAKVTEDELDIIEQWLDGDL